MTHTADAERAVTKPAETALGTMDSATTTGRAPTPRSLGRLGGGTNQAGGRAQNERLVLSLVRLNGPLPKADLARLTGLSAQAMSLIVRRLEGDGLLRALDPVRGRVGQPSIPYALDPRGAGSFGVKIGRRSTDVVLCDFEGRVLQRATEHRPYPEPERVRDFAVGAIRRMRANTPDLRRIVGVGVAMPFDLWKWTEEVPAPTGALDRWRGFDVAAALSERTGLPAFVANDASAACAAEIDRSHRGAAVDLLYLFVGAFAGGGVAIGGRLYPGRTGNAGALGSMPVVLDGVRSQLLHHASLLRLERAVAAAGGDPSLAADETADWSPLGAALAAWIERAADAMAQAIAAALAVIDFAHVCVDGALPRPVLAELVAAVRERLARAELEGLSPFEVREGTLGGDARVLGGALLPIANAYGLGTELGQTA